MEAVAGVAAGVVLVLGEGVRLAIAEVDSDIAVIARELDGRRALALPQCFGRWRTPQQIHSKRRSTSTSFPAS